MNNFNATSFSKILVRILPLLFFTGLAGSEIQGQNICHTAPSSNAIGPLGNASNFVHPNSDPLFLRIYVHALGFTDITGTAQLPTQEDIQESLSILSKDFAPHNIFFVWDCNIIPVLNNFFYYGFSPSTCILSSISDHPDGIDLFIGVENAFPFAQAKDIPGKFMVVLGAFYGGQGSCPQGVKQWTISKSHNISHEMGHCLGLWHTHHRILPNQFNCDGTAYDPLVCNELANGSNSATCGDYVTDTPADPELKFCDPGIYNNCTYDGTLQDANGDYYDPDETLIMSYAHDKCVWKFSPGQVARMRQIILTTPVLLACLVQPDYTELSINSNTTWTKTNTLNNGDILIENDLVIESGATLTIDAGVTVHFGTQGRLIIKPNAKLMLNGTLTGAGCQGITWQGVKVWGSSPLQSQYPLNGINAQGRIECLPGSRIENARVGIQLYGPNISKAGGQIVGSGATLKNCRIGIEFGPYQNFWPFPFPIGQQNQPRDYVGLLKKMQFLTDAQYPHLDTFHSFVHMTGVNGIRLLGCSFANKQTVVSTDQAAWGYGIFANDAGFSVSPIGPTDLSSPVSNIPCRFSGLGYGIYTARILNNRPYTVKEAEFEQCFIGIRNKSVAGGTILFNNFKLGQLPASEPFSDQVGVIFETDVAGFTCEENNFYNLGGNATFKIGTVCINTGIANKTIRRNNYYGLDYGNIANMQNASQLPQDGVRGLYYDCNQNFDVLEKDFSVPLGRIKPKQGLEVDLQGQINYNAAGNRFSYTTIDFSNFGAGIEYFYNQNVLNEDPLYIEGNIFKTQASPNACASTYCEPPCKTREERETIKADFYQNRNGYHSARSDYALNSTEEKARQMAYYQRTMDEAAYTVLIHELYDTTTFNADTLQTWIRNLGSIEGDLWLAQEQLAGSHSASATSLLNAAITRYQLTDEEQTDIERCKSMVNIFAGKSVYALDETSLQSISQYLNAGGSAEGWARSIATFYGKHFPAEYIKDGQGGERSAEPETEINQRITLQAFTARPNPAKDYVEFVISLPDSTADVSILIFDLNGKQAIASHNLSPVGSFVWNTADHRAGIYFYHIIADGKIQKRGKIVLNK